MAVVLDNFAKSQQRAYQSMKDTCSKLRQKNAELQEMIKISEPTQISALQNLDSKYAQVDRCKQDLQLVVAPTAPRFKGRPLLTPACSPQAFEPPKMTNWGPLAMTARSHFMVTCRMARSRRRIFVSEAKGGRKGPTRVTSPNHHPVLT